MTSLFSVRGSRCVATSSVSQRYDHCRDSEPVVAVPAGTDAGNADLRQATLCELTSTTAVTAMERYFLSCWGVMAMTLAARSLCRTIPAETIHTTIDAYMKAMPQLMRLLLDPHVCRIDVFDLIHPARIKVTVSGY